MSSAEFQELIEHIRRYIEGSLPTHKRHGGEADRQLLLKKLNNLNEKAWARLRLAASVGETADRDLGEVILPTASSSVYNAVRELRRFDGTLVESFDLTKSKKKSL
jgi:hypothetical protein